MTTASYAAKATYVCSGGTRLTAVFSGPATAPGNVVLSIAGTRRTIKLPQVMSADGGRYSQGDVEFWIKGKDATLNRKGTSETCRTR
jgi:membrane-bound inhibitor of C-type lysozyme